MALLTIWQATDQIASAICLGSRGDSARPHSFCRFAQQFFDPCKSFWCFCDLFRRKSTQLRIRCVQPTARLQQGTHRFERQAIQLCQAFVVRATEFSSNGCHSFPGGHFINRRVLVHLRGRYGGSRGCVECDVGIFRSLVAHWCRSAPSIKRRLHSNPKSRRRPQRAPKLGCDIAVNACRASDQVRQMRLTDTDLGRGISQAQTSKVLGKNGSWRRWIHHHFSFSLLWIQNE